MKSRIVLLLSLLLCSCSTVMNRQDLALEFYNIGNAYFEMDKPEKAMEYYIKAVELDGTLNEANYNLARAYIEAEKYKGGLTILRKLLKRDANNTMILNTVAYALYRSGEREEAVATYDRVLEISPRNTHALYNMGLILVTEEKYEEAGNYLEPLIEIERLSGALRLLGSCYSHLEREEEAIPLYEDYLSSNSEDVETLGLLTDLYLRQEVFYRAVEKIDLILDQVPETQQPLYHFDKGKILILHMEEYQEGIEALSLALEGGFSNKTAVAELLEKSGTGIRDTLQKLFEEYKMYP